MARRTIFVSDLSGEQVPEGKVAQIVVKYSDGRKGVHTLDVTESEADEIARKGRASKTRGRRPASAT